MKKSIIRKFLLTSRKKNFLHSFVTASSFATMIKLFVSQDKALLETSICISINYSDCLLS